MQHVVLVVLSLGGLAVASGYAQPAEIIEWALAAAPNRAREGAAVIQWNPDHTYVTLKGRDQPAGLLRPVRGARPAAVRGAVHQRGQPGPCRPEPPVRSRKRKWAGDAGDAGRR